MNSAREGARIFPEAYTACFETLVLPLLFFPRFYFFIYERDYRALEIRYSLIRCRIRDKQRFAKLRHTFSAKRYNRNYFMPLVHASQCVHCCS